MGNGNMLMTILPLAVLILAMYLLLIRPQKKKEKEINTMRNNVRVGDEVVTIGGICGKIVKTKDESLVIQVGADRVKFEIMRWAVSRILEPGDHMKESQVVEEPAKEENEEKAPAKPKRMKKAEKPAEEKVEDVNEAPKNEADEVSEEVK